MAQILPNIPLHHSTPVHLRLFRLLRGLPDERYRVWQRLEVGGKSAPAAAPSYWLVQRDRRSLFLQLNLTTRRDLKRAAQPGLFGDTSHDPLADALAGAEAFQTALAKTPAAPPVPLGLLFANLGEKFLPAGLPGNDIATTGKDTLSPESFAAWIESHLGPPLSDEQLRQARLIFTPEIAVPANFTVHVPMASDTDAELTDYLLDARQERLLKNDLDLSPEAGTASHDFGLRLISGVAGSGKSLIILYRAHLLRQLFPAKRVLGLTHNRPLMRDLRRRYRLLSDGDREVEWHTFMGWCRRHWPAGADWREPVSRGRRDAIVAHIQHAHLRDSVLSPLMLLEEIDWYKDRLLFNEADYLAADRTGRGFALNEAQRRLVYGAMSAYHAELQALRLFDWGDVPRQMWRFMASDRLDLPRYDVILIDEAQFFAPIWFEIIKQTLKPRTGYLFLVADPSQGFLKRGQSWLASGLDVRGRSNRLRKSYRTTREILDFATLLYRRRLPQDNDGAEIIAPDMTAMPHGPMPVVIPLGNRQDEALRVGNEIAALLEAGVPLGDMLVIQANWRETGRLQNQLTDRLGRDAVIDPGKYEADGSRLRVCSLHAATGLESPIVFLVGAHALYEEEQSLRLSDSERADLVRDNTRKLYMALTRAGQRLVVTYVGTVPAELGGIT